MLSILLPFCYQRFKRKYWFKKKGYTLNIKAFVHSAALSYPQCILVYLLSCVDASTVQFVDVLLALVHEAADQPVIAEHYTGHLGDVLVTLVL